MKSFPLLLHVLFLQSSLWTVDAWNGNFAFPSPSSSTITTKTPPKNVKLLILPGFGNDPMDYELPQAPEGSLIQSLQARGWKRSDNSSSSQIRTLPMQRLDWLQVFWKGCFDVQFWAGTAPPTRPAFAWYLESIATTVEEMCSSSSSSATSSSSSSSSSSSDSDNTDKDDIAVVLVCHSAGGWLARAALGGDGNSNYYSSEIASRLRQHVLGIITLGTPHLPPPPPVMDMTRGALKWTDATYPGAFFQSNNNKPNNKNNNNANEDDNENSLFYISVVGDAIAGQAPSKNSKQQQRTPATFAHDSYEIVCGDGTVRGDGVVPLCAAHLDGAAHQLTLEGVFHSINAPAQWYGSNVILDRWHDVLLQEINQALRMRQKLQQQQQQQKKKKNTSSTPPPPPLASLFGDIFSR